MFITRIMIQREGYSDNPDKPFIATVHVHGKLNKTELTLSPDMSARVVAVIADEIIAAGKAAAEAMVAETLTVAALPRPEAA